MVNTTAWAAARRRGSMRTEWRPCFIASVTSCFVVVEVEGSWSKMTRVMVSVEDWRRTKRRRRKC